MKTFSEILKEVPGVKLILKSHQQYQAHIHDTKAAELLHEHIALVNKYAATLVETHGLDAIIDKLIVSCTTNWKENGEAASMIKSFFVDAIVFHDFGKVNENFQVLRMKNKAPFSCLPSTILKPPYGHSFLGTFIYLCYHLQSIIEASLPDETKYNLVCVCFFLAYPILQHHSPVLIDVTDKESYMAQFKTSFEPLKHYLKQYDIGTNEQHITWLFSNIDQIWKTVSNSFEKHESFSLFALLKLNFSLLTAADYLATHEYMNSSEGKAEAAVHDFGVFESRERIGEIIRQFQSIERNANAYNQVDNFQFHFPEEKSNFNLNQLRQQMAVSLIQTVRKHTDKRLFYIEAPTGGGKTNLSIITVTELLQANPELNKVFYVFPFTTLITQTFGVLKESLHLSDSEIVEMHSKKGVTSKANVQEEENDEEMKEDGLYGNKKKDFIDNLFALFPVTLLSHVKFFSILNTNRKEENYLMHRLANSVVIVDEIQSYNPAIWDKMLYFISQYAMYFNTRFVLMSATLPKISKLNLQLTQQPYFIDLLPKAHKYITNKNFSERVTFNFELFDTEIELEALADIVIEKSHKYADGHGSVKTIVEFIYKKSAASFRQLIENNPLCDNTQIFILSGTVLEPRRKEIINFIKRSAKAKTNILLITTQVVEAGVDIDMDLGFKNVSLLDSDEQLAGRVNRNAFKDNCEVYLFKVDDAGVLYGKDFRYKQTRAQIKREVYEDILKTKNFEKLYTNVLNYIDDNNKPVFKDSFYSYEENIQKLRYKKVNDEFKIIDQEIESVFVPLPIPVHIDGVEEGKPEQIFSDSELFFLKSFGVLPTDDCIDGSDVWKVYDQLIHNEMAKRKAGGGFDTTSKLDFKILQGIMSKFSFSLLGASKDYRNILEGFAEEKYGYLYFSFWNDKRSDGVLYSYEDGLNNKAFSDANFI